MRFLLIDRIVRLEVDRQITATKNLSLSEDVFSEHFAGYPLLPGSLLVESLAQAGSALLEVSSEFKKKALPVMIDRMKFRRETKPGDQLLISMNIMSLDEHSARLEGTVHAGEQLVADGIVTFALKQVDKYYPEKMRYVIETLYDIWLRDTDLVGRKL